MAKKNITIGFPEEKLNVLLYFLNREQQNLEPMLEEQLDKLYYDRYHSFYDYQVVWEKSLAEENQEAGQENTSATKEVVKEARRNKRQERQAGQTVVQKPDAPKLDEDVQEEEGPGMQMGM